MHREKIENGVRLCVWIPNRQKWILAAIEDRVKARENEGIPSSKGDIIREILAKELETDIL